MIRGLYTAGTAMLSQMKKMDVITNNLSNVDTTGFKEDNLLTRSFDEVLIDRINDPSVVFSSNEVGPLSMGIHIDQVYTDFEQGPLEQTQNKTDLSIQGEGFFVVSTPNGDRYTRSGNFQIDSQGRLTTKEGYPVMGENGEITLNTNDFEVKSNGDIYVQGNLIDKIKIRTFNTDNLRKAGDNLYMNTDPQDQGTQTNSTIAQGYLEGSNVNLAKSMVDMMEVYRNYESNQKVVKMLDDTIGKAVSEIGKI